MRPKKYICPSIDEEDCGVASLAMILKNYGSDFSLAKLRTYTKTTTLGLKKAAEHFDLEVKSAKLKRNPFPRIFQTSFARKSIAETRAAMNCCGQ